MPPLSRLAIRAALIHLLLGLTFGMLLLINKGISWEASFWRLLPAHTEFLLVGWTAQLAMAVSHWIIPRFRGGDYGRLRAAQSAFVLLNLGVLLAGLSPTFGAPSAMRLAGRLAEGAAAVSFAIYIWPRIRQLGQG